MFKSFIKLFFCNLRKNKVLSGIHLLGLIIGSICSSCLNTNKETPTITPYVQAMDVPQGLDWPTYIGFFNGLEIISDAHNNRFAYRPKGSKNNFKISPVAVHDQHSLTWCNGTYYAVNTNEHAVIEFSDISKDKGNPLVNYSDLVLERPHDIVYNPVDGYVYVIDNKQGLTRFKPETSVPADVSKVGSELNYARSLTLVDGEIYISNSSQGEVVHMKDFNDWTVYKSPGKKLDYPAGAYDRTGLVLNDVERFNGYWYGSNYFTGSYADGHDFDKYRLIRWRTWEDFQKGNWEDLSPLLPKGTVPYYFTINRASLYVSSAQHEKPGVNDIIYKLDLK